MRWDENLRFKDFPSQQLQVVLAEFRFSEHNSHMREFSASILAGHLIFLARALVERKEWSPDSVDAQLGWEAGRYRKIVEGPGQARLEECFELFQFVLEAEPANQPRGKLKGQVEHKAATSLPVDFYARSPYRDHPASVQPAEVLQHWNDATPGFIHVLGFFLQVSEALKEEGHLEIQSVQDLLRDYLLHLIGGEDP